MTKSPNLRFTLNLFEKASGLKIKQKKIHLKSNQYLEARCSSVEDLLNLKTQTLPFLYLGVPLDGQPNSMSFGIIPKLKSKKKKKTQPMEIFSTLKRWKTNGSVR